MCEPEYKYLPCNSGYCPFGSSSMETCKIHCNLEEEKEEDSDA